MISFAVHAPDAKTFWQSWIAAGIATAPHVYTPDYADCVQVHDWGSGAIPGKTGWFANVYVTGRLEQIMTAGKTQVNVQGQLLNVFDRTRAVEVFKLTWRDKDSLTNFPAGYINKFGVRYADMKSIATPYNVRL